MFGSMGQSYARAAPAGHGQPKAGRTLADNPAKHPHAVMEQP
jgi:hypothetical protein